MQRALLTTFTDDIADNLSDIFKCILALINVSATNSVVSICDVFILV